MTIPLFLVGVFLIVSNKYFRVYDKMILAIVWAAVCGILSQ